MRKSEELNKLIIQANKLITRLRSSVMIVPEQNTFQISIVDNGLRSEAILTNKDSLEICLGDDMYMSIELRDCIGSTQFITVRFSDTPSYHGSCFDA